MSPPLRRLAAHSETRQVTCTCSEDLPHQLRPEASHWTLHCAGRYRLRPALWRDRLMLQLLGFIIDCPDPMKLVAFTLR
jgi:hypothetical protein